MPYATAAVPYPASFAYTPRARPYRIATKMASVPPGRRAERKRLTHDQREHVGDTVRERDHTGGAAGQIQSHFQRRELLCGASDRIECRR